MRMFGNISVDINQYQFTLMILRQGIKNINLPLFIQILLPYNKLQNNFDSGRCSSLIQTHFFLDF